MTRPPLEVQWAGTTRVFDQDRVVVGRETDCDVTITDGRASRHHVIAQVEAGSWVLVDASSNGTFVSGQRIGRMPLGEIAVVLNLGDPAGEPVTVRALPAAAPPRPAAPPPAASAATEVGRPSGPPQPSGAPPPYRAPSARPTPAAPPPPPAPVGAGPAVDSGDWWRQLPPPQMPQGAAPQAAWEASRIIPPGQLAHGQQLLPAQAGGQTRPVSIGRDLGNDVVLDDPLVSRRHARLEPGAGGGAVLHDLGSFNGTFVNGARVQGSATLAPGSEVIVGNQTFRWDGAQLLASATQHEFTLYADGLTQVVGDGKILIENITFQLQPKSLTAVIGPSGAGKSTLLGALTGLRPASHGRVVWQGHDLYQHYDQLRFQIGLVPQQDIQHPQLKVKQALGYAAELRLPPDTTVQEREARVHTVAGQLQLLERLDNRIGTQLSGGQKKRVSIATELLTAPPLLFLDEPTSGLDPGLDLEVMKQLRALADDGRVVMVVTHSVLALDVCDNVMVLAPGGRIAYFGPPSGVLAHFGVDNYPQVFDLLDDPGLWQRIPVPQSAPDTARLPAGASPVPAPPRQRVGRQLSTLLRRNASVVVADKLLLGMLVLLPLILGGLSRLVPGGFGLSLDASLTCPGESTSVGPMMCRPPTPPGAPGQPDLVQKVFDAGEVSQRVIVLIVAACLMGTAIAIRELVAERPIFRREYAVGLSPSVYFSSKVAVLGTAAFLQGLLVTFIATVGLPGADGQLGTLRVAVTIGALAFTMAVIGLALSALVSTTEQTMPTLVGVIMLMLVLSGSLFEIAGRPLLEQVAWLSPSRWGYAAAASAMGLVRAQDQEDGRTQDWIALAGAGHYLFAMAVLAFLCAIAIGVGLLLTRRSATED